MREAASRGFWVASHAPFGYNRAMVQDGVKDRPTLEVDPVAAPIVKEIFESSRRGNGLKEICKELNGRGITNRGRRWQKNIVHYLLTNEAYTGTAVWGLKSKDEKAQEPVRVENAWPALVSRELFDAVQQGLHERAPTVQRPARVGSQYLLSGLLRCGVCGKPYSAQGAKSGQYAYYVYPTSIKVGKHACETPTLNARRFEELVVNRIRSNILTEDSIRDLVKVVESEMGGVTRDQRQRLETIDTELADVRQRLGRLYNLVETTDMEVDDFKPRIRELRERQDRLECSAAEARAALAQRHKVLDDVNAVAAYAREMKDFLEESELTERRAFIETFVKEILVVPGDALMRYTVPMPSDSLVPGKATDKVALPDAVLSTVHDGGPRNRAEKPWLGREISAVKRRRTESGTIAVRAGPRRKWP